MRISDWSSDVCSSDLIERAVGALERCGRTLAALHCGDARRKGETPYSFAGLRHLEIASGYVGPQPIYVRSCFQRRHAFEHADELLAAIARDIDVVGRSEEHTSELQSLMRISYAVLCLKKKN